MNDLDDILFKLGEKRPIFHSEADFQHSLAWEIHLQKNSELRLEYPYRKDPETIYQVDIVVLEKDKIIPIELKYKTKEFNKIIYKEMYSLKNHGADDQASLILGILFLMLKLSLRVINEIY